MSDEPPQKRAKTEHKKLTTLPSNAKISKRPLLHPTIPSPYAGSSAQKVVYVNAKTPFLAAVKRVEKLLHLADKRLVQSATTIAKQESRNRRRRNDAEDEIGDIARIVEGKKAKRGHGHGEDDDVVGEEVMIKGTGRAIQRVMELGLWFQQREEYNVRLRTGTAAAIDDIEVDEDVANESKAKGSSKKNRKKQRQQSDEADAEAGAEAAVHYGVDLDATGTPAKEPPTPAGTKGTQAAHSKGDDESAKEPVPATRIRYTSVLEVAVSLR